MTTSKESPMQLIDTGADITDAPELPAAVAGAYSRERFCYFDIETIPSQSPALLQRLRDQVKPPATYKKPESIEEWLRENRETAATEALAKTSFDGGRGHVCTIAWAFNDGEVMVRHAATVKDEALVIGDFFASLDPYHSETLVGHNIARFDLRFLRQRAICLGIRLPDRNKLPRDPKPWDKTILDTMSAWAGGTDTISLDNLCDILGIPGKDGFDGSQVAAAWAAGEHDRIAEYCRDDVFRVRAIHHRFLTAAV